MDSELFHVPSMFKGALIQQGGLDLGRTLIDEPERGAKDVGVGHGSALLGVEDGCN
jgi:hypothetical protein